MEELVLGREVAIIPNDDGTRIFLPERIIIEVEMMEHHCSYITEDNFDFSRVRSLKFFADVRNAVPNIIGLVRHITKLSIQF